MSIDDNDDQMIFGDLGGLMLPDICLTGEEKPRKASPRKLVSSGDRTRPRWVTGAHANTWPTAVDDSFYKYTKNVLLQFGITNIQYMFGLYKGLSGNVRPTQSFI